MAEVEAYVNEKGEKIMPNAEPGDVRFVDVDGNGEINDEDKTYIGKGIPDWVFGFNIGFEWKGFDFSMLLQGQLGAQAYNVSRRIDLGAVNLPKYMLNRWTGEGTSNKYPKFEVGDATNYVVSDVWVEDASFLRARNVQFGYTLPQKITRKFFVQRLRVYAQAENLFTLTKYQGCDPEVTGGNSSYGTEVGIDRGVYPQSRTFSVGVNLTF
jgi:hypothetical protein